jgi:flagellar hook-associated protein FlgK
MNAFPIGISALAAGQRALDLIGQNIANANTPGYHRQAVNLVNRTVGGPVGTGVDVASLTRYDSPPARTAIVVGNGQQGDVTARLGVRQQIESILGAGTTGIPDRLENFFNSIEQLTSRPDDVASRRSVVSAASDLANRFTSAAGDIDRLRADVGGQVTQAVGEVNSFAKQVADLNSRISLAVHQGNQPNDLIDQRDKLVDQISHRLDVRIVNQPYGVVNVIANGAAVVVGEFPEQFKATTNPAGNIDITTSSSSQPIALSGGKIGGLLQEFNQDIPATRARLDNLAGQLIQRVNQVQATGIGLSGPLATAAGTVGVADPTQPLASQNLPFPVQAGQLTVSVTDAAGNRTNTAVAIDPATMSLNDVATALSGVPGLSASVDAASGTLRIDAQAGYSFDFAGRDTNPPGGGAVANPDTAGLLSGLGVNGLFTGTNATGIAVRPDIVADPGLLAGSVSGQPGDGRNLERLAAVRDQPAIAGRTLGAEFTDIAATVGSQVSQLDDQNTAQAGVMQSLNAQEQSVAGVDVNEELVNLLAYQRMVQGASQYMSVVNDALDSIMNIIK